MKPVNDGGDFGDSGGGGDHDLELVGNVGEDGRK